MTTQFYRLALGFGFLILAAQQIAAGPVQNCAPRAAVIERLTGHFGETQRGIGMAGTSRVLEVFASGGSGSWTITITRPDGTTCVVAAGDGYETITEPLPARDAPT